MEAARRISPHLLAESLRECLHRGIPPTLSIVSDSMMPLLRRGDEIVLTAFAPDSCHSGDILTYFNGTDLITHRFWQMTRGKLIVRGDRPVQCDPPVSPEQVIGLVQVRQRNGRSLSLVAGTGAKLNRHLARLAEWESQRLLPQGAASDGNSRTNPYPVLAFRTRLLRRVILAYALLVCSLVDLAVR